MSSRTGIKRQLARLGRTSPAAGSSILIYHRVGGGSPDERDLRVHDFVAQLDALTGHDVVALDEAIDRIERGDARPAVVLTFDDGFADVHAHAWPLLKERGLPFTIYLATSYVGGEMHWDGSTAKATGPALTWDQLTEMHDSGLLTVGNHTHTHARPERLDEVELDRCSDEVEAHLGVRPQHFAYTWGIPVPAMEPALRARFRSAATGELGRNLPDADLMRLRRIPVRQTDPIDFFRAKLAGSLLPERAYASLVGLAKRAGAHA